ncbi:translation initiation factor IF-2 [Candidatus Uhrbacteria bacterium]|jgi:translation initiation factor IF-2|nr:translation initiation factor IF-2 [Candidatus Uhrbacteria bacterium]
MSINVTHLARRLRVPTKELLEKLPELGFSLGKRAIKVNDKEAAAIQRAWGDMKRKEAVQKKHKEQQEREERRLARLEATKDNAIELPSLMTVRGFAEMLELPVTSVIQELMRAGVLANMNQNIDFETAAIVAGDMGFHVTNVDAVRDEAQDDELDRIQQVLSEDKGETRAPVVVVMGHVDHGKTRLLDAIRKTHIIDTEAGGITQHIGAYQAKRKDQEITFIDTPGHEAFTVMRSRGAKVADIAILVVAADDGVQPQTKEAIDIVKATGLPMIVAINKMDVAGADPEKVKRELADLNLSPEEWGGKTIMVPISAKQEQGIDELLDALLLVFEVEKDKITANPDRAAIGTIIESHVDKGAGPVATVLIQSGTLKPGNVLGVRGENYGKVRAMEDYAGARIKEAGPSVPVKILGWKVAPVVGDVMEVADAKSLKKTTKSRMKSASMDAVSGAAVQRVETSDSEGGKKVLNIILKADVLGSVEAILGLFDKVKHDDVGVHVVHKALGNVTEADIARAEGTGAIIIGFHVQVAGKVDVLARDKKVEVLKYDIIYKLFEDVVERLQGMLSDEVIVKETGKLEVLAIFSKLDNGMVVGGKVTEGRIEVNSKLRVWRAEELIGEGDLADLRVGKESIKDVEKGTECGIQYVGKTKIEEGDILEAYVEEKVAKKLVIEGANA